MERGVLHWFTGVFESVENFRWLKDIDIPKVMMRGCHHGLVTSNCRHSVKRCDSDIIAHQGLIPTGKTQVSAHAQLTLPIKLSRSLHPSVACLWFMEPL